ncbi:MAG: NAD(P)-dependent oxidoreductase, partial [Chloroflexota bacterium]
MPKWKILIADKLNQEGVSMLSAAAEVKNQPGITHQDLLETINNYDALIVRGRTKVSADIFAAASNLKVVGRAGVGVDNIDLAAAQSHGAVIVNAPTATSIAVAEHAVALMLSTIRFVPRADSTMKSGLWLKKELIGSELSGKTLGVIGMGNIGSGVAQRAAAFGMTVLGYDP